LKLLWKTLRPNIFIHYEVYYDHLNYICLSTRYFIKYRAKEVLQIVLQREIRTNFLILTVSIIGRLARIYQHTMPREFIDFEIRQALEWLLSGHHFRATTAVCVLAELLQNVPTLINVEVIQLNHNNTAHYIQI
jgi:hypothetical protein